MKNVAQIFGKKARSNAKAISVQWPLPKTLMGLEIEAERTDDTVMPVNINPYWTRHRDGSLISDGGQEYVLATPLSGESLSQAIADIFEGTQFERTPTGSTHIHMDMLEEGDTQEHIKVLTLMIFALEQAIFAMADKGREWCGYTNKLMAAPDSLISAVLNAKAEDDYRELHDICYDEANIGRYYGLNLLALAKYGSLEFRYFPTCTSKEELIDWIKLVQSFKKAAIAVGTQAELERIFNNIDLYEQFISQYFEPWQGVFLQEVNYGYAHSNLRKAIAIADASKVNKTEDFDDQAILSNKVFAKFVKNTKRVEKLSPYFFYDRRRDTPDVGEYKPGHIMFQYSGFYMASATTWAQMPWRGSRSITLDMKKRALNTINKIITCFSNNNAEWIRMVEQMRASAWSSDMIHMFQDYAREWSRILAREIEALVNRPTPVRVPNVAPRVSLDEVFRTVSIRASSSVESESRETPMWAEEPAPAQDTFRREPNF